MPGRSSSEFDLIRRYFARPSRRAALGVGDDAALIAAEDGAQYAVTMDSLNEGVHFLAGTDPHRLGHKALAVNLSDLAAMGAEPRTLLALTLPGVDEAWLEAFAAGLFALAERYELELIGGDTTRGPCSISITAIGAVRGGALRREGAGAGDEIWVSGELGGAALRLACLEQRAMVDEAQRAEMVRRLEAPTPRVELGLALRGLASAAIDLSDGLTGDLLHILECSGAGASVEYARIPRPAALKALRDPALEQRLVLAGGDDYELLFTVPPARGPAIEAIGHRLGVPLVRIGSVRAGVTRLDIVDAQGRPMPLLGSHDHFAA